MKNILLLLLLTTSFSFAQIQGCTDRLAKNFDVNAIGNDGSCIYDFTKIKPESSLILNDTLTETSGLTAFNNLLWTHNDDHDKTIYGLDTDGKIQSKISLDRTINHDWEEISQDSAYLYLGDFGNNAHGNRKDLHILRIEKQSFLLNHPLIDTISFSYSNQTDFTPKSFNTSDFDCEAFVILQDSIYLFTKQWSQQKTSIYVFPKNPGNHLAQLKETIDVDGLITGVTELPSKNGIVLCGYSKKLKPFLYLLYDYKNYNFSTANKRKIELAMPFHQVEGIATFDGLLFYLANESFVRKPILNIPQKLSTVDLNPYLLP